MLTVFFFTVILTKMIEIGCMMNFMCITHLCYTSLVGCEGNPSEENGKRVGPPREKKKPDKSVLP